MSMDRITISDRWALCPSLEWDNVTCQDQLCKNENKIPNIFVIDRPTNWMKKKKLMSTVVCLCILYNLFKLNLNLVMCTWGHGPPSYGPYSIQLYIFVTDWYELAGSEPGALWGYDACWKFTSSKQKHWGKTDYVSFILITVNLYKCECMCGRVLCLRAGACACMTLSFEFLLPLYNENMHKILPQSLGNGYGQAYSRYFGMHY